MALLFLVAACQDEEVHMVEDKEPDATAENVGVRTFSLTASMPEGSGGTRVAFTQDGKNVSLTWEEGDQLDLLFVQGETKVKQSLVQVSNISADGKRQASRLICPRRFKMEPSIFMVYMEDWGFLIQILPLRCCPKPMAAHPLWLV